MAQKLSRTGCPLRSDRRTFSWAPTDNGKVEIRRGQGLGEPRPWTALGSGKGHGFGATRWIRRSGPLPEAGLALHQDHVATLRGALEFLHETERPANSNAAHRLLPGQPEPGNAGPLRKIAAPRDDLSHEGPTVGDNPYPAADAIAVAPPALKSQREMPSRSVRHVVAEGAQLTAVAVLEDQVLIAVGIQVNRDKRPAVGIEIQTAQKRDVSKPTVPEIPEAKVALPTAPRPVPRIRMLIARQASA